MAILQHCESLSLSTSKHLNQNKKCRPHGTLQRCLCKLHSTAPLQYQDTSDELVVSKKPQFTVVKNCEPKSASIERTAQYTNLSIPLINYICVNQTLLLLFASLAAILVSCFSENPFEISSFHWNDVKEFHSLFDWQPSMFRLIQGFLASIPMITVGHAIHISDNPGASRLNFTTTNMVLCLFGRRKSVLNPDASAYIPVLVLSTLIAISSGISEEIIFRGYIPTAISTTTQSIPLSLLGQAVLFASGHLSRNAKPGENKLSWSLQFLNGIWYGVLYLMTGGDILPCIIAHILYDMYTLCETWTRVNDQLDYSNKCSSECTGEEEEKATKQLQLKTGITFATETIHFARNLFYAFDINHAGSLSLHDCQRAVSYAFLNDVIEPETDIVKNLFERVIEQRHNEGDSLEFYDRLDFVEFFYLLFILRSRSREPFQ